jgi:hypothetical protein
VKKTDRLNAAKRRKRASGKYSVLKWGAVLAVVAGIFYGLSQTAGVAFDEDDIRVVDFSPLSAGEKRDVLREANRARCPCGCGMTLAQCVSTDTTCPIREPNIERIKTMVRDTDRP